jgi:hypothetical protein
LNIFPQHYDPHYEDTLLDFMFGVLAFLREERKHAKDLFKAFEHLPQADSERLTLLRTAVKCSLSREDDLLKQLLASDLSVLSDERKRAVLDVIVRSVFRTKDEEEMEKQLTGLFATASDNSTSLLMLLRVVEQIEFSKKVREILKTVLEQLTQDGLSAEMKTCVDNILKPPPSLFSRLTNKFSDSIADLLKL